MLDQRAQHFDVTYGLVSPDPHRLSGAAHHFGTIEPHFWASPGELVGAYSQGHEEAAVTPDVLDGRPAQRTRGFHLTWYRLDGPRTAEQQDAADRSRCRMWRRFRRVRRRGARDRHPPTSHRPDQRTPTLHPPANRLHLEPKD